VDDNLIGNREYAMELFDALTPLGITWDSQTTAKMGLDEELLKAAAESGCVLVSVGFESSSPDGPRFLGKLNVGASGEPPAELFKKEVANFHSHGINVVGNFVFGLPWEGADVFDNVLKVTRDIELDAALFHVMTPYPGIAARKPLEAEGRIATPDWRYYTSSDVVFVPDKMTPEELQRGLLRTYETYYSKKNCRRRTWSRRGGFLFRLIWGASMRRKVAALLRKHSWPENVWSSGLEERWAQYREETRRGAKGLPEGPPEEPSERSEDSVHSEGSFRQ
jgi:radical SAM superfamily enzyme YgiQ (UPF0313 family)